MTKLQNGKLTSTFVNIFLSLNFKVESNINCRHSFLATGFSDDNTLSRRY